MEELHKLLQSFYSKGLRCSLLFVTLIIETEKNASGKGSEMTSQVVFMRKTRSSRSDWTYVVNNQTGNFTAPDVNLTIQIGTVVEHLLNILEFEDFTVVSPQVSIHYRDELEILYPDVKFIALKGQPIIEFFDRAMAMAQTQNRRRPNQNILYIGADASAKENVATGQTHSAWAWASGGVDGGYDYGYSGEVNVNVSELEGIMQAIIANADSPANRIHIYSDSANAVDMFNYDLIENIVPREARKHGMVGLAKQTIDIIQSRPVTVEWVKGHRQHRLNMIADSMSRIARKRFVNGASSDEFSHEINALYTVFSQSLN